MKNYSKSTQPASASKYSNHFQSREIDFLTKMRVLVGGFFFVFGLFFFVFGMIFVLIFGSLMNLSDLRFSESNPVATGKIIETKRTSTEVGEQPVYKYVYTYQVEGKKYQGVSYAVGNQILDEVTVQYLPSNPSISRIKGMKNSQMPIWVMLFLLIFPSIGLFFMFLGIKKNLKFLRILAIGKVTFGVYSHMQRTNISINKRPVYKVYFRFYTADNQEGTAVGETHLVENLQDEQVEPLIYNPQNPTEAIMIDALPPVVRRFLNNDIEQESQKIEAQK